MNPKHATSEVLQALKGNLDRASVQAAIQRTLSQDNPNLRLLKQLCALDLSIEVEQTVLLQLDDRARNLNNPARLAATYKDLRSLMKADDDETTTDGWDELLSDAVEAQEPSGERVPSLALIHSVTDSQAAADELPLVVEDEPDPVTVEREVETARCTEKQSTLPYPRSLRRKAVALLLTGRRSKASIARDCGVSLATIQRWHRLHIGQGKPV